MVINDYSKDIRELCSGPIAEAARKMGVSPAMAYKYIEKAGVTKKYEELCEALGYDIKLTYIKREERAAADIDDLLEQLGRARKRSSDLTVDMYRLADMDLPAEAKEIITKWAVFDEEEWR